MRTPSGSTCCGEEGEGEGRTFCRGIRLCMRGVRVPDHVAQLPVIAP
jgi:hypothetical protein